MFMLQKMHQLSVGGRASAISYIGSNAAAGTTITIPTHQAGDLIVISGYNRGADLIAAGSFSPFISFGSGTSAIIRGVSAYKIAASSSETSGTWTGASHLVAEVFRGTHPTSPIGASNSLVGDNSGLLVFPSLILNDPNISWIFTSAYWNTGNSLSSGSTSYTQRATASAGSNDRIAVFDSNGPTVSTGGGQLSTGGGIYWGTCSVEIKSA